jgi:hypothetical protein
MKAVQRSSFNPFDTEYARREIDEELRFHLELLTEELLQQDLSLVEAQAAARRRFGNIDQIKDQCAEISRKRNPLLHALKAFMVLVFLSGVLVRVFSPEFHLTRMGNILMAVGLLGRLLLYVRGLNSSSFFSRPETLSPLRLNDKAPAITAYDQRERTPVERIIFDK